MTTTNKQIIITATTVSVVAAVALAKVEVDFLPVAISYLAVGAIFVLAAMDNRRGSKNYLAR